MIVSVSSDLDSFSITACSATSKEKNYKHTVLVRFSILNHSWPAEVPSPNVWLTNGLIWPWLIALSGRFVIKNKLCLSQISATVIPCGCTSACRSKKLKGVWTATKLSRLVQASIIFGSETWSAACGYASVLEHTPYPRIRPNVQHKISYH